MTRQQSAAGEQLLGRASLQITSVYVTAAQCRQRVEAAKFHAGWRARGNSQANNDVLEQRHRCRRQAADAQAAQVPRPPARDDDRQASRLDVEHR